MPIANETFTRRQALAGLGAGSVALTLPESAPVTQVGLYLVPKVIE